MNITKSILTATLLLIGCVFAFSQQTFVGGISFGLSGAQVDGDKQAGYNKFGLFAQAFVYTKLSDRLGLQSGIGYSGRGARRIIDANSSEESFKTELHYAEVPLLISVFYRQRFKFDTGLSAGYLFHAFREVNEQRLPDNQYSFNSFDLSGVMALNFKLNEKWSGLLRFSYSFTPIAHHPNQFNNVMQLGMNYNFR